jgi:AcrR family transcriptional regulator
MPNRATSLRWDDDDAAVGETGGLSRRAIVAVAVRVADAEGLGAVSIRRVAGELGARPMSLYTHIASKDDLVDLMLNEVVAEVVVPEPLPGDWRAALRAIAERSHVAFRAHPWTLEAAGRPRPMGPNAARHGDQTLRAGAGIGLPEAAARAAVMAVDAYTLGYALFERIAADRGQPGGVLSSFDDGLEIVLDGIAAQLDRQ